MSNWTYLVQRSYVTSCLDIVKMKEFIPCDVEDELNLYKGRIIDVVFDPLKIKQVNDRFARAGYIIPKDFAVIAITADDRILLWGGLNSVYYLGKGEELNDSLEVNLAFNDIVDLTGRFKIKNKKAEIDELLAQLKEAYSRK